MQINRLLAHEIKEFGAPAVNVITELKKKLDVNWSTEKTPPISENGMKTVIIADDVYNG